MRLWRSSGVRIKMAIIILSSFTPLYIKLIKLHNNSKDLPKFIVNTDEKEKVGFDTLENLLPTQETYVNLKLQNLR